ncbi:MAG: glycosyl hydrolase, partial [Saprospiraceae bacterium]|nr:glycosyl hydrolase [Saprospiraceae bacterium]
MMRTLLFLLLCFMLFAPCTVHAQKKVKKTEEKPEQTDQLSLEKIALSGLAFRSIGPAVTSGRVIDIDVNPQDHTEYYVASGHGSLWKTTNGGVTFSPIFDGQTSFAMGAVTLDPSNPKVVWVGTGENNAHSYVIPGDGVYKSEDGGKSWTNKGLKESQHIGAIVVHPDDPNTVWVAAYGPHRASGGQRGVYRTKDGGETWEHVL